MFFATVLGALLALVPGVAFQPSVVQIAESASVIVTDHIISHDYSESPPTNDDHGTQQVCSGVVVADLESIELIATAAHCDQEATPSLDVPVTVELIPVSVDFRNGDTGKVIARYPSKDIDVEILAVLVSKVHAPAVIGAAVEQGEYTFTYGMNYQLPWALSSGIVMATPQKVGPWPVAFTMDCSSCFHGDSGAGVWDTNGRLIGILVGGSQSHVTAVAVPIDEVVKLEKATVFH